MGQKEEIIRTLERMHGGELVEIRALHVPVGHGRTATWSGYFDDYAAAAHAAIKCEQAFAEGVYVTLNRIHDGLLARAPNHLDYHPRRTTSDSDVIERRWMLIDVDPLRPAGISSTASELSYAVAIRDEIAGMFCDCPTLRAMSGNGAHLLVGGNDFKSAEDIVNLDMLAAAFNDDRVRVDTSTGNLSRITRLYGTKVRKGHPIPSRPHRFSRLED